MRRTIWQGMLFAAVAEMALGALNYRLLLQMAGIRQEEDFSYRDTYTVVYRGILENSPYLAILFWFLAIFIGSMVSFGILKWIWVKRI
ncbi:hypothetical protein [Cohnella nanjingensis]|nr:hypothetical protein [Cohnella nanjingensis]